MNRTINAGILVIGNDSHFCYLMRRYIRKSENRPMIVNPDDNVLTKLRKDRPAAIVIDIDNPGEPGLRFYRTLKECAETAEIPVLICSWSEEPYNINRQSSEIYLRMPILYDDFVSALTSLKIS